MTDARPERDYREPKPGVIRDFRRQNRDVATSFERHMRASNWSPSTLRSYGTVVQRFLDHLGPRSVLETQRADIHNYLRWLAVRGLAPHTLHFNTSALRSFFKFTVLAGLIKISPMLYVGVRKLPRRCPRVLTIMEIEKIIAAAANPIEIAIIETLYSSGVRCSELTKLRLENIHWGDPAMLLVQRGKCLKDRYAMLGSKAVAAIRAAQEFRPSQVGWLFESPARDGRVTKYRYKGRYEYWLASFYTQDGKQHRFSLGKHDTEQSAREYWEKLKAGLPNLAKGKPVGPYSERAIHLMVQRLGRAAGVGSIHPHMFRRAFCSHLLDDGADIRAIQELAGHARISNTALYAALTDKKLRSDYEKGFPSVQKEQGDRADEE